MAETALRSGWVDGDGVRLHYVDWPGEGPPLLCLHGLTGNARIWDALAERLSPRHRVIAVDLRGRGLSDKPPQGHYGLAAHVRDIATLIPALGIRPAVVVGHSMGAFIAALLAAGHPELVGSLGLMDGGGSGEEMTAASVKAEIQSSLARLTTVFPSFAACLNYWRQAPFLQPWPAVFERFLAADVEERPDGTVVSRAIPAAIEEDITQNVNDYHMEQVLPLVQAPSLVLWAPVGVMDPARPLLPGHVAERVAALLPGGRLVTVAGANHYTILLAPACLDQVEAALL